MVSARTKPAHRPHPAASNGNEITMIPPARAANALRQAGFPIAIVSCGGTATYGITTRLSGVTEVQAGGGILSDVRYRTKLNFQGEGIVELWGSR